jgi:HK97 family phage major capsid protein
MATSTEYFNSAREALTKASAAINEGKQEQYDAFWADYESNLKLGEQAKAAEDAQKALAEKVIDPSEPVTRNPGDAVMATESVDTAKEGVLIQRRGGGVEVVKFADKNTEGWIKGLPPDAQHPDIVARLTPDLKAAADFRREAFYKWMRKGRGALDSKEIKALQEGTDSEGGFVVPSDQVRLPFIHAPGTPGGTIRSISSNFTTTRDAGDWPTVGSVVWAAVAEEAALPSTTDPVFGQVPFTVRKVMGHHKVSAELLEDSAVNLPAMINQLYSESLGRYEDQQAIEGDGTTEPQGIRTSGGVDATGIALVDASDGWDAGNIINQFVQLPAEYRGDGCAWHTTSTTLGRIWGVGATAAGIHFLPDPSNGAPTFTLMGKPVYAFDGTGWDTALSGTNEYGCIGNFRMGYYFINRVGMSIKRLDELYAGNDQVGFVARIRYDSVVAINGAFVIMKGEA